jgi:hypothetical protein
MLPLAPVAFPLTFPAVRPRGIGAASVLQDETTALTLLETELERQVRRPERRRATRPFR